MTRFWEKPHVFKRYGVWTLTAPGVATRRFYTWEAAMEDAQRWWER